MAGSVRRTHRLLLAPGVAVAAAVAVVGAVAVLSLLLPRLLAEPDAVPERERTTSCRPRADLALADADSADAAAAAWVRFCPLEEEGAAQRVRHPQGVVTGDLAASVAAGLWQTQVDRPVCEASDPMTAGTAAGPTGRFRIEVGLADGRVAELAGDTGCSTRDVTLFGQLETTLLMDATGAMPTAEAPPPVRCPRRLTTVRTNDDGTSAGLLGDDAGAAWQSTVPLLPLPASTADVCAYTGRGASRRPVGTWRVTGPDAEALRSSATLGVHLAARVDCAVDPGRTSYLVVLTDQTGTARSFAIDTTECGSVSAAVGTPADDTWLGLATPRLVRAVARTRP